jgi:hypothetical protein
MRPRQRFFKKKIKKSFICRGPVLDKETANGVVTTAFFLSRAVLAFGKGFVECPIKGLRQRSPLLSKNSPRGLCRGQPSAKPLPRVSRALPRVRGPQQSL